MLSGEIQQKCREILNAKYPSGGRDHEQAHQLEDELREKFIEHVAAVGGPILSFKAQMVLSTKNIDFHRWCA